MLVQMLDNYGFLLGKLLDNTKLMWYSNVVKKQSLGGHDGYQRSERRNFEYGTYF